MADIRVDIPEPEPRVDVCDDPPVDDAREDAPSVGRPHAAAVVGGERDAEETPNATAAGHSYPCNGGRAHNPQPGARDARRRVEEFEKRVRRARTRARWEAILHIISRYLALCALTWATAVLLGGFVSTLATFDFFVISCLLLAESVRLFIIHTIANTLSRDWFREKPDPQEFKFQDKQQAMAHRVDLFCQTLSAFISLASLSFSIAWFARFRQAYAIPAADISPAAAAAQQASSVNLQRSLYIVYILFLVNSVVALLFVISRCCHRAALDPSPGQTFLKCFHDEVYRAAINDGLSEIDRLDVHDFAFTKLGRDFERNIRPQVIKEQNRDLIGYLYSSNMGVSMVYEALKTSSDPWQQVVAANLPGFWADEHKIEQQLGLIWALGEKMQGSGKAAEGALNSIQCLAQSFKRKNSLEVHPFLAEDDDIAMESPQKPAQDFLSHTCIVSRLIPLVCKRARQTLLFQIRALDACLQDNQIRKYVCRGGEGRSLQLLWDALKKFVTDDHERARTETKVYAASAMVSLLDSSRFASQKEFLREKVDAIIKRHGTEVRSKATVWLLDVIAVQRMIGRLKIEGVSYKDWLGNAGGVCVRCNTTGKTLTEEDLKQELEREMKLEGLATEAQLALPSGRPSDMPYNIATQRHGLVRTLTW